MQQSLFAGEQKPNNLSRPLFMVAFDNVQALDDGRVCPEVGGWAEEKHRHVSLFSTLFSSAMKEKWDKRVYVELYAGAGYSRVRGTSKLIVGSPLLALKVKDPFDKYVFCEEDSEKIEALEFRVKQISPRADVAYVPGDCNKCVEEILTNIPEGSKNSTVLSLCFADPYDIGLKFETLRTIAESRYIDFLVLLALFSDARRAYKRYVMEDAVKVDQFLESRTWRDRWRSAEANAVPFPKFLAEEFAASMETIGYIRTPIHKMKLVRSDEKNLPLYYIAPFSKHPLALKFWDEARKYGTDQRSLFES
jgi:three-Cys-motif partner protein